MNSAQQVTTRRIVQGQDESKHENHLAGTEHMVIIVTTDDGTKWLTDVGLGGQVACHPVRLDEHPLDEHPLDEPPLDQTPPDQSHLDQPKGGEAKGMLLYHAICFSTV